MSEKIIEVNTAAEMYEMLTAADRAWVDEVLKKAHAKLCKVRERSAKKLPSEAQNGVHDNKLETRGNIGIAKGFWTNGFWAGMLWQMYAETGDERYREIARFTLPILDGCLLEMDTHDIGFLWLPTAVLDYKITGDEGAKNSALAAAKWLAGRFNPAPNIIRAWGSGDEKMALSKVDPPMRLAGVTIIDCMMNLPLLYWASNETGDPRYRNIAMRHADMAMQYFVREDGSVIHINEFDPDTGAYVDNFGGQGYGKGSAWSRGQGWGLCGFTDSYKATGKKEYLETAKKIAAYVLPNIPADGLVPSDFRQPPEPWVQDDIAACVLATALIDLAELMPEQKDAYLGAALRMLHAIDEKSADWSPDTDPITLHGTAGYHLPGRNINFIYADYYYIEAVRKLKGRDTYLW